jgi:hypothetical protein
MNSFTPEFDEFRFYENDGSPSESTSTPLAAEGTDIIIDLGGGDVAFQLRVRVQETGSLGGAFDDDWSLQYQVNGSGGFTDITGSSTRCNSNTSGVLSDGSPTTNRGTDGISDGTGSFVAGEQESSGAVIENSELTADNFTEHVWALDLIAADTSPGDFLDFRMRVNGGAMSNVVVPRVSTPAFDPEYDAWRFYAAGTEAGSSPLAAQNAHLIPLDAGALTITGDTSLQLRIRAKENSGGDGLTTDDYDLRVSHNEAGTFQPTSVTTVVQNDGTSALVGGNDTTERLTGGSGSFVAGEQVENSPLVATDRQLTASNFMEHVFAFTIIYADVLDTDTLGFKMRLNGSNFAGVLPIIEIDKQVGGGTALQDVIMGPGIIPFAR